MESISDTALELSVRNRSALEKGACGFRKALGRPLRVGGINYLNSRPLMETFEEVAGDDVVVSDHLPSKLARLLRIGELDVALVPVVEYFLAPPCTPYWIVPGVGISSYGSVESIRLFHRRPLGDVGRIALDTSSMTSAILTRLLFAERPDERWRSSVRKTGRPPAFEKVNSGRLSLALQKSGESDFDAVLLIGDDALRACPSPEWKTADLGLEWTRWTGLPFVYAFWVYRGDPILGIAECLQKVRHTGYARIDKIVQRGPLPGGKTPAECLRYLSQVIRYGLGPVELEGVRFFVRQLRRNGLLAGEKPLDLRFLGPSGRTWREPL